MELSAQNAICDEELGCGSACTSKCPFGFPCVGNDDCLSTSCTAFYCDVGRPAKFQRRPIVETPPGPQPLPPKNPLPFPDILNKTFIGNFTGRLTYYGDSYGTAGAGDPPPLGPQNGGWYGACYDAFGLPKNWNKFAALVFIYFSNLYIEWRAI